MCFQGIKKQLHQTCELVFAVIANQQFKHKVLFTLITTFIEWCGTPFHANFSFMNLVYRLKGE